jgi:hypothetical protein
MVNVASPRGSINVQILVSRLGALKSSETMPDASAKAAPEEINIHIKNVKNKNIGFLFMANSS